MRCSFYRWKLTLNEIKGCIQLKVTEKEKGSLARVLLSCNELIIKGREGGQKSYSFFLPLTPNFSSCNENKVSSHWQTQIYFRGGKINLYITWLLVTEKQICVSLKMKAIEHLYQKFVNDISNFREAR